MVSDTIIQKFYTIVIDYDDALKWAIFFDKKMINFNFYSTPDYRVISTRNKLPVSIVPYGQ